MKMAIVLCCTALLIACDCGNEPFYEVPNLDGVHRAVVFNRNCGATVAENAQVSLLVEGQVNNDKGNVFIADAPYDTISLSKRVHVTWQSADTLMVTFDRTLRVFSQLTEYRRMTIVYVQADLDSVARLRRSVSQSRDSVNIVQPEGSAH